jgi:hypothetical protein
VTIGTLVVAVIIVAVIMLGTWWVKRGWCEPQVSSVLP